MPVAGEGIDEALQPVSEVLPLQPLARQVALDHGGDTDHLRELATVTRTR